MANQQATSRLRLDALLHPYGRMTSVRRITVILVAGVGLACGIFVGRPLIRKLDAAWFGYTITDAYVRMKGSEDWSAVMRLRSGLDFRWARPDGSGTIRIAHALGAWRSDHDRDTVAALHQSLAKGFRIAEVDLALGSDEQLHCYHGADGQDVRVPASQVGGLCTLDMLIGELRMSPFTLVLDLKSNFKSSAAIVAARVPPDLRHRIVFQLYSPNDIATFNRLPRGFAGPIVTLYRSLRTVHHLDPILARIGARIVTVPFERIGEFGKWGTRDGRILLTHPIEDCAALADTERAGFRGGYMDSDLACPMVRP